MRRTAAIVSVAALAPLLVLAAMWGGASLNASRDRQISERLNLAREVNAQIDSELLAAQAALRVLAGTTAIQDRDWPIARARAAGVVQNNADWRNVILTDAVSGREIWELASTDVSPRPARDAVRAYLQTPQSNAIGNVAGAAPDCPCLIIHAPIYENDRLRYVMSAELTTAYAQQALVAAVKDPDIGAVVDRRGNFIARTRDYRERLGQPATHYVRDAIAAAPSGVYEGVTYEGLRNRSAYVSSHVSGFSTHIAIPRLGLSALGVSSTGLSGLAILVALLTAIGGIAYAVREQQNWREREQKLARSQKLEAIGRLASGVAHDFNNYLTVILASARKLERNSTDSAQLESVAHIRAAAERGAGLVKQLMSFAREQPFALERVDLGATMGALEGLLRQTLGAAIDLVIETGPDLVIATNRAQLEAALLNLAANARDAMPDGGTFSIRTKPAKAPNRVDVIVADTGAGMPEAVLDRALDPFFSTKGQNGTGLGLAQVQALMAQSGGSIEISSALGRGTSVLLSFANSP